MNRIVFSMLLLMFMGVSSCGGGSNEMVDMCKNDCLGDSRQKVSECGEDQACKASILEELKACEKQCEDHL